MLLRITPSMLVTLAGGHFFEEACEAICNYFEEFSHEEAPLIGDIIICFGEISSDNVEDDDNVLAYLNNGNAVIMY